MQPLSFCIRFTVQFVRWLLYVLLINYYSGTPFLRPTTFEKIGNFAVGQSPSAERAGYYNKLVEYFTRWYTGVAKSHLTVIFFFLIYSLMTFGHPCKFIFWLFLKKKLASLNDINKKPVNLGKQLQ